MKNERNMSNSNQFNNEDLGCFLPTSLLPEILNNSDLRSQKQHKNMFNKKEFLPFDSPDVRYINYFRSTILTWNMVYKTILIEQLFSTQSKSHLQSRIIASFTCYNSKMPFHSTSTVSIWE